MARDYSTLTGQGVLDGIRKTHRNRIILDVLGIIAAGGFLIGSFFMFRERDYIFCILFLIMGVMCAWLLLGRIGEHLTLTAAPEKSKLFRKYGSPESIAARIAAESSEPLFAEKTTLLCRSFILNQGDFETFIPLDQTLLAYRKESSTNGIKHNVYLVVQDVFGDKFEYPFKLGKKHKEIMMEAMQEISRQSPQCAVGYSPANLNYAKQNTKPLP